MSINKLLVNAYIKIPKNQEYYKYYCELGYKCIVKKYNMVGTSSDLNESYNFLSLKEVKEVIKFIQNSIDCGKYFYNFGLYQFDLNPLHQDCHKDCKFKSLTECSFGICNSNCDANQ